MANYGVRSGTNVMLWVDVGEGQTAAVTVTVEGTPEPVRGTITHGDYLFDLGRSEALMGKVVFVTALAKKLSPATQASIQCSLYQIKASAPQVKIRLRRLEAAIEDFPTDSDEVTLGDTIDIV